MRIHVLCRLDLESQIAQLCHNVAICHAFSSWTVMTKYCYHTGLSLHTGNGVLKPLRPFFSCCGSFVICMFSNLQCKNLQNQTELLFITVRSGSFHFIVHFNCFLKVFKRAIFWVGIYCLMLIVPKYIFSFI